MKWVHLTILMVLVFTQGLVHAAKPQNNNQSEPLTLLLDTLVVCPPDSPERFVDNGDGTICDHQTGLMWEKKNAADGVADLANPHDVDNHYFSNDGFNIRGGPAYTDFLVRLNVGVYSDWRLPTSAELQTLLFEPYPCSITPCIIDPVFAPTADTFYVSFTAFDYSHGDLHPWRVSFFNGRVIATSEAQGRAVRAVRGSMGGRIKNRFGLNPQ